MLWERVAVYLGFTEFDACKVMGLAAYGDHDAIRRRVRSALPDSGSRRGTDREGRSRLSASSPSLRGCAAMTCRGLESLFGPRRSPEESPDARSVRRRRRGLATPNRGGRARAGTNGFRGPRRNAISSSPEDVALNCVSNARLEREGPFRSLFVPCAAHDAGTAIGAALDVAYEEDVTAREIRTYQPQRAHAISRSVVRRAPRSNPRSRGRAIHPRRSPILPAWRRL